MLDRLRQFVSELSGTPDETRFGENDYRLAAAALLVHAMGIDGHASPDENARLHAILSRQFELDDAATQELIDAASEADRESVDLYRFTSLLNRTLNEAGRKRVVEMMWEVVLADGRAGEFEENLLWRAADLLGISTRERVELRQQVAGRAASPTAES